MIKAIDTANRLLKQQKSNMGNGTSFVTAIKSRQDSEHPSTGPANSPQHKCYLVSPAQSAKSAMPAGKKDLSVWAHRIAEIAREEAHTTSASIDKLRRELIGHWGLVPGNAPNDTVYTSNCTMDSSTVYLSTS